MQSLSTFFCTALHTYGEDLLNHLQQSKRQLTKCPEWRRTSFSAFFIISLTSTSWLLRWNVLAMGGDLVDSHSNTTIGNCFRLSNRKPSSCLASHLFNIFLFSFLPPTTSQSASSFVHSPQVHHWVACVVVTDSQSAAIESSSFSSSPLVFHFFSYSPFVFMFVRLVSSHSGLWLFLDPLRTGCARNTRIKVEALCADTAPPWSTKRLRWLYDCASFVNAQPSDMRTVTGQRKGREQRERTRKDTLLLSVHRQSGSLPTDKPSRRRRRRNGWDTLVSKQIRTDLPLRLYERGLCKQTKIFRHWQASDEQIEEVDSPLPLFFFSACPFVCHQPAGCLLIRTKSKFYLCRHLCVTSFTINSPLRPHAYLSEQPKCSTFNLLSDTAISLTANVCMQCDKCCNMVATCFVQSKQVCKPAICIQFFMSR